MPTDHAQRVRWLTSADANHYYRRCWMHLRDPQPPLESAPTSTAASMKAHGRACKMAFPTRMRPRAACLRGCSESSVFSRSPDAAEAVWRAENDPPCPARTAAGADAVALGESPRTLHMRATSTCRSCSRRTPLQDFRIAHSKHLLTVMNSRSHPVDGADFGAAPRRTARSCKQNFADLRH